MCGNIYHLFGQSSRNHHIFLIFLTIFLAFLVSFGWIIFTTKFFTEWGMLWLVSCCYILETSPVATYQHFVAWYSVSQCGSVEECLAGNWGDASSNPAATMHFFCTVAIWLVLCMKWIFLICTCRKCRPLGHSAATRTTCTLLAAIKSELRFWT